MGGNVTFGADTHSIEFGVTCLAEDFPTLATVLANGRLRRPTFPPEQVGRVREQRLVVLQERDEDTASVANLRFYEGVFGRAQSRWLAHQRLHGDGQRHSAGADRGLPCARLRPTRAAVAVTGAIDSGAALGRFQRLFGAWQGPALPPPVMAPAPPPTPMQRITLPGKVRADIVVGARAVPRNYPTSSLPCAFRQLHPRPVRPDGAAGRRGARELGLAYYCYFLICHG